jgi:hypothetical protein
MPAKAGIHLFFAVVARCLEMDSGLRRNDKVISAPINLIASSPKPRRLRRTQRKAARRSIAFASDTESLQSLYIRT